LKKKYTNPFLSVGFSIEKQEKTGRELGLSKEQKLKKLPLGDFFEE